MATASSTRLAFSIIWSAAGIRVINGLARISHRAFEGGAAFPARLARSALSEGSRDPSLLRRPSRQQQGLRWPIVVKPNIGGSGAGVKRFDTPEALAAAAEAGELAFGLDSTALVQEFIPARDSHIVRVEVLNGKYLYAIKVHITGETFDLCPADICRTTSGVDLNRAACPVDAPKTGISVEGYQPPADVIADVERIMSHAGIELGGVEYITDDRDGQRLYYDINALSNFVADGANVVGFDPFVKLVDWLEDEAAVIEDAHPGI